VPREYKALVFPDGIDKVGHRATVMALDGEEARRLLEARYGNGNVLGIHNEADARRPR
jgi:hypothetical protein